MSSYNASQWCGAYLYGATTFTFVLLECHWPAMHNPFMILDNFIVSSYTPYEQRYISYFDSDTKTNKVSSKNLIGYFI